MEDTEYHSSKRRRNNSDSSSDSDSPVVEISCNQRKALPGEPVCVVCGRYGAYICDTYNVDVCSTECKETNKGKCQQSALQADLISKTTRIVKIDKVTTCSAEQRPALPSEAKCIICSRFGIEIVLDVGKVCSIECKDIVLTPDRVLQSPKLKLDSQITLLSIVQHQEIRKTLEVHVLDGDATPAILDFKQVYLNETLFQNMNNSGYKIPTAVQSQVIPIVLDGSDVLVCSGTGTGKTGAYLIPMIHRIQFWVDKISLDHVFGLVILPTRDMAIQVEKMTKELCKGISNMRTGLVVGGLSTAQQNYRLESNIQIVVCTPGRLLELSPDLSQCFTVVLDEFDVLLDASFHEQVKSVMRLLPSRHQTLMFSATISEESRRYAKQLLYHPVQINVGKPSNPTEKVKQMILWVENDCKKKKLISILQDKRFNRPPVLVFVESKLGALLLADYLINKDILCAVIHGDKTQEARTKIISELEEGRYPVLVSTNILGRGINMPSVSHVILFDLPPNTDQYVHQIGRALSENKIGTAFIFINNTNKSMFLQLYELSVSSMVTLPIQLVNSPHLAYQKQSKAINENRDKVKLN